MATYTAASTTTTRIQVASTKVYIGTQTTTPDNDAFVEVGQVTSVPDFGGSATAVKTQFVGQNLESTDKGVVTFPSASIECARNPSDTGQTNMITASQDTTSSDYNIRIIAPNKATSTGTGTTYDIKCKVLSAKYGMGGPNNVEKITFELGQNTLPTITAAV